MSAKMSGMVFDRFPDGGGIFTLALAIADHAHDDGTHVFPSVASLARKSRQSDRSVQYQLRRLEKDGWLILVGNANGGRGTAREYAINPAWILGAEYADLAPEKKGAEIAPFKKGATDDVKGANQNTKGATDDVKGATAIAPEPSITIKNHQEPKTKTRAPRAEPGFVLPDWVPAAAWDGFVAMRQKIRKPLTDRAVELLVKELDKLRAEGNDPESVLDRSVMNSWQGIFALPADQSAQPAPAGGKGAKFDPSAYVNRNRQRGNYDEYADNETIDGQYQRVV